MNPSLLKRKDLSRISTELDSIFSIFSEMRRYDSEYLTVSIQGNILHPRWDELNKERERINGLRRKWIQILKMEKDSLES